MSEVVHGRHMQQTGASDSPTPTSSNACTSPCTTTLTQLPADVVTEVCARLASPADITSVSRTCRALHALSASPLLATAWLLRARPRRALATAAARGMAAALRLLITHAPAHGLELGLQGPPGTAALTAAAQHGHCDTVRVLLAAGVPADGCDCVGGPLAAASNAGQLAVMQLLLAGVKQGTVQQAGSFTGGWWGKEGSQERVGAHANKRQAEQGGDEEILEEEAVQHAAYLRLVGRPQEDGVDGRATVCSGLPRRVRRRTKGVPEDGSSTCNDVGSSSSGGVGHGCLNAADVHAGQDAALVAAATAGQEAALVLLLDAGATAMARSGEALCCAAAAGHVGCGLRLMAAGCCVGLRQGEALRWAAMAGHLAMLQVLWEAGGSAHAGAATAALGLAARAGHCTVVAQLVAWGADVHAGDEDALFGAAGSGHTQIVATLVAAGADVRAGDGRALRAACDGGHTDAARVLLAAGADPGVGGQAPVKAAARSGSLELLRLLLAAGADPHTGDEAPLRSAASAGAVDVVRELLGEPWRADPNANDQEALLWAADNGHGEVVAALLYAGATANGPEGALVLWAAVARGHSHVVRLLMDHGSSLLTWHMCDDDDDEQRLEGAGVQAA